MGSEFLDFFKMHGLGNDFIIIDGRNKEVPDPVGFSRRVCDRHTGVGADGLMIVYPSNRADIRMAIYNSDGSEAEMCGNGLRCFARHVYNEGIVKSESFTVETLAGIMKPRIVLDESGGFSAVAVDMGRPGFEPEDIPVIWNGDRFLDVPVDLEDSVHNVSAVLMGVPHAVVYVEDIGSVDVPGIGSMIENHPLFPRKTNVNFVKLIDEENIAVRTWERGAGSTLACGTGCCAAAVVSSALGKTKKRVRVHLQLGELLITWGGDGRVLMEGPALYVFSGRLSDEIYPLQS
jgi:diaminopimelate epimerase